MIFISFVPITEYVNFLLICDDKVIDLPVQDLPSASIV